MSFSSSPAAALNHRPVRGSCQPVYQVIQQRCIVTRALVKASPLMGGRRQHAAEAMCSPNYGLKHCARFSRELPPAD